jgi:anti-sigma factor RsiW
MLHPDEGRIHAWLDGELPEDQANEIATHARDCPECSAKVAEARGLIAASTRILTALDDVPSGVIPETAAAGRIPVLARPRRRWYDRMDVRAAAALLVVAGASYLVVKRDSGASRETLMVADKIKAAPMSAETNSAVAPPVASPIAMQRAAQPPARRAAPPASRELNEPMAKTSIVGGAAHATSAMRLDAVVAASRDTVPPAAPAQMALMLPQAASTRARARALGVVEGRVIDKKNEQGIAGASVIMPGTSLAVSTDKDGRFSITNVPAGEQHFIVRRIGYQAQNISIAVPDDASVTANVALEQQVLTLSQVVTTGAATATSARIPLPRVISVDSTTGRHRTVYEISPGVRVTLFDTLEDAAKERVAFGQLNARVAGVAQRPANESDEKASIHAISWTDHGHRYELSGPVPVEMLQALKQRLIEAKR